MRYIKLFLISVVILFGVLTALSLLFPSHLRVSRAINIAASRQKVYEAVDDLQRWDSWNAFTRSSELTGKKISSPSKGSGATFHADQLEVRMTASTPDSIISDWRLTGGKHFVSGFNLMQLSADSLTVQWWMDFHFRWYPWEKMGGLVYDKKLGPLMEGSLTELKRVVENTP